MTHMSSNPDGTVSDAELAYYARRTGGAGMSVTAVTHVTPNGSAFLHNSDLMMTALCLD